MVYPVRLDERPVQPQAAGSPSPSLVLADGGLEFPDGSVQTTAAVGEPPAPLRPTGQTPCYDAAGNTIGCASGLGRGQDGHLLYGVTWPIPRFTDNADGTVTDNLTGLIVESENYWSSTSVDVLEDRAWASNVAIGGVQLRDKDLTAVVWPVRN